VDANLSTAQCVALTNGKFVEIGSDEALQKKYTAKKMIDLQGKYIYPGFMDPHCHFYGYGLTLAKVDLRGTQSYNEVIERAKQHHSQYKSDWVTGRGWDQNNWEPKVFPTKELLDKAFPNTPVLLRRIDGHAAIANSSALNRANITVSSKFEGGKALIENGKLTGLLIDKAVDRILDVIPAPSNSEKITALLQAQKNCFAVGLTSVSDAGLEKQTIELIDSLQKDEKLQMRIYAMLEPTEENIETFLKKGPYKTPFLNVRSLKLYADGALGSRGACLLKPYSDDIKNAGIMVETPTYLKNMCALAYENNYQVNTHCIGDSANRVMLAIYASILQNKNDRRWRIEHAQVVNPEDINKYGAFSIIPSVQTTHCTSDMGWAEERLGSERIKHAYAWQDLLKQNGWLPNGSDFPIEDINPLFGFYAAVTRQNQNREPENGFYPKQKLTRIQALKAMTIWAARAQFEENEKGSIEPGKFADFIVVNNDLLTLPENQLYNLNIEQTYSHGKLVFAKD
jgi:predicted amidohydrolase YtcJ